MTTDLTTLWAPLVYARTFDVDFRLIAAPEDFTPADETWAIQHVLGTTRAADQLYNQPRWSIFINDSYCVVGVTCMASDLIQTRDDEVIETLTRDSKNRPVYLFAGYVTQRDDVQAVPNLAAFADRNLEAMRELYELVRDRWFVQPYQRESQTPFYAPYRNLPLLPTDPLPSLAAADRTYFNLNADPTRICLWATTHENSLWLTAIQQAMTPTQRFSLCLGVGSQAIAVNSCFLNATVAGVHQREDVQKTLPKASQPLTTAEVQPDYALKPIRQPQTQFFTPEEVTGAALGSAIGGLVTSRMLGFLLMPELTLVAGLPGFVVGGAIGWIVAGCMTDQGVGGEMLKQSQTRMKNSSKSRRQRKPEKSQPQYGLKFRDKQQSHHEQDDWF